MNQDQKSRIFKLIDQAIMLDFAEIGYWKQCKQRNSDFAKRNVIQANESIKNLSEIKQMLNK